MLRFFIATSALAVVVGLSACNQPPPPAAPSATPNVAPAERLMHLVAGYWDEYQQHNPLHLPAGPVQRFDAAAGYDISTQALADSLALERRYRDELMAIPRVALPPEARLSFDIFRRERELAVESFVYPTELMPLNPFRSLPFEFARTGAGTDQFAVLSARDYDNWQARAAGFVRWTAQAIANMRDGLRRGYTLPRPVVVRMLPSLSTLGTDSPTNVFYRPVRTLPSTLPEADRRRFAEGITASVRDKILPAYRQLHDFLRDEYLPRSRQSVGLSTLPLGQAWYAFLVRRETASKLSPAEIHALGKSETDRLHGRLQALLTESGFAGSAQAFFDASQREPKVSYQSAEELLGFYAELKTTVAAALATQFAEAPQADFAIRAAEVYRDVDTPPLEYVRAANHDSPAVLYVDTRTMRPQIAAFLRAALPGHHFQIALQTERSGLPRFRRFGGDPGFVEGWGLYAESLGEELGVYKDTEARYSSLADQLECAALLVVDTGMHSLGWSRDQALDYLKGALVSGEARANFLVDRSIALPAESLACGLGLHAIRGLRSHAEQVLGTRFDVRNFHSTLIGDGAMPLDILESAANLWLGNQH